MALGGPGGEDEQQARAALARDRTALGGLEEEERSRLRFGRLLIRLDAHRTVQHQDELVLAHLMLAELLARLEADEDGAPFAVRMQDGWGDASARRVDLAQVPPAHGAMLARTGAAAEGGYDCQQGAVAEWLGSGLQSRVQRFESARRLSPLAPR